MFKGKKKLNKMIFYKDAQRIVRKMSEKKNLELATSTCIFDEAFLVAKFYASSHWENLVLVSHF